jgi:deaminated glutathione amidase
MFLAAALQMNSGPDKGQNLAVAQRLVKEAQARGATMVALPENFSWMGPEPQRLEAAEPLDGPTLTEVSGWARQLGVTLLAGSLLEQGPGGRVHNTCVLFGPDGARLAAYRKIHLFDVELGDGATYRESALIAPGEEVVVAQAPGAKVGLSVCYDLRFPELYRRQSALGATVLTVPAAFTLMTGKDHWEVLLRARAIENLCHVIAPAQWGRHSEKRITFGHALVVDPWGVVVARASEGVGMAVGPVDPALTARVRERLPSLNHRKL